MYRVFYNGQIDSIVIDDDFKTVYQTVLKGMREDIGKAGYKNPYNSQLCRIEDMAGDIVVIIYVSTLSWSVRNCRTGNEIIIGRF